MKEQMFINLDFAKTRIFAIGDGENYVSIQVPKEHVKVSAGVYVENGIGHCAAENSKANGANWFYVSVYKSTVQIDCKQFKSIKPNNEK